MIKINIIIIVFTGIRFSYAGTADPEFSLHNQSNQAIIVDISNSNLKITETLNPDGFINHKININNETRIIIWGSESGNFLYRASFNTNKTIYLNWKETHSPMLYPQRGPHFGLRGVTDLGFSTKNNVGEKQITRLPNPAYVNAGLPDPGYPDFCEKIKQQFSAEDNGYNRASQRYHPDNCSTQYEAIKNLWREVFKKIPSCYGNSDNKFH